MTVYTKSYAPPPVNRREILRYAGVRESNTETEKLLNLCLEEAKGLVYKVCYAELSVISGDTVDLGFMKTTSKTVKTGLEGCERAIVFAATVGIAIDRLVARYSLLSPSRALMLQAIGAERVESLCDAFCRDIAGCSEVKPRFSAGYGDFPIEAQRDIFNFLDCPRKIGVTLTDSMLMSPTKSVTAIFGIQ